MHVDEAGNGGAARAVDFLGAGGQRHGAVRADRRDPAVIDQDRLVRPRRCAGAVDDQDMLDRGQRPAGPYRIGRGGPRRLRRARPGGEQGCSERQERGWDAWHMISPDDPA